MDLKTTIKIHWMRNKFGRILFIVIVTIITFAFVFTGVLNPANRQNNHYAALVNGEPIYAQEFLREHQAFCVPRMG